MNTFKRITKTEKYLMVSFFGTKLFKNVTKRNKD